MEKLIIKQVSNVLTDEHVFVEFEGTEWTYRQVAEYLLPPEVKYCFVVDGRDVAEEELDTVVHVDCEVVLYAQIQAPVVYAIGMIWSYLATSYAAGGIFATVVNAVAYAAAMTAISYGLNALFGPKPQKPNSIASSDMTTSQSYGWNPAITQQEGVIVPKYYGTMVANSGNVITAYRDMDGVIPDVNTGAAREAIRCAVSYGFGPIKGIREVKINDQYLDENTGLVVQRRYGFTSQARIAAIEDFTTTEDTPGYNVSTTCDLYEHPIPAGTHAYEVVLHFPSGLYQYRDDGSKESYPAQFEMYLYNVTTSTIIKPFITNFGGTITKFARWSYGYYGPFGEDASGDWMLKGWREIKAWYEEDLPYDMANYSNDVEGYDCYWRKITVEEQLPDYQATTYKTMTGPVYAATDVTFQFNLPYTDGHSFKFYIRRIDAPDTLKQMASAYVSAIRYKTYRFTTYPRNVILALSGIATERFNNDLDISAIIDGAIVNTYNGTSWTLQHSSNPAWIAWDVLTQPVYTNRSPIAENWGSWLGYDDILTLSRYDGFQPSQLNLNDFYAWAQFCDVMVSDGQGGTEKRFVANCVFDADMSLWDAVTKFCENYRALIYWNGSEIRLCGDFGLMSVSQRFNDGNIIADSLSISYIPQDTRANEVELSYLEEGNDNKRTVLALYAPEIEGGNKTQVTLFGTTRASEAWRIGKYLLACNKYINRIVKFSTSYEALHSSLGDVIEIQHSMPDWAAGGRIASYNAATKIFYIDGLLLNDSEYLAMGFSQTTIDGWRAGGAGQVINNQVDTGLTIGIRTLNGTYAEYAVYGGGWLNGQTQIILPAAASVTGSPQLGDLYCLVGDIALQKFKITDISIENDNTVSITAVDYNEQIYVEADDCIGVSTPTLTIPDRFPNVSGISAYTYNKLLPEGGFTRSICISWEAPNSAYYSKVRIYLSCGESEDMLAETAKLIAESSGTQFVYNNAPIYEYYKIHIATVNTLGNEEPLSMCPSYSFTATGVTADGVLSIVEKLKWHQFWLLLQAEVESINTRAVANALCTVVNEVNEANSDVYNDWITAYNALSVYVAPLFDNLATPSAVNQDPLKPTEFQDTWGAYTTARILLLGIILGGVTPEQAAKLEEFSDLIASIAADGMLSVVEKRVYKDGWDRLVAEGVGLNVSSFALGICEYPWEVNKDNTVTYNAWLTATNAVVAMMNPLWADMKSNSEINVVTFQDTWDTYVYCAQALANEIVAYGMTPERQAEIDAANQLVSDISSDSVFSAAEKAFYHTYIATAYLEYPEILARATSLGLTADVTYTMFVSDSEALDVYLVTIANWDDLTVSSDINPTTFNTLWNNYFVSRQKLRNRISVEDAKLANFSQLNDDNGALAQLNADVAAANATVAALVDDDVITSAEKKGIIPSYQSAVNDYFQLYNTATTLGINTTAFVAAGEAVNTAMKPIFGTDLSYNIDYHLLREDYSLINNGKSRQWFTDLWATYWNQWSLLKQAIETTAATTATWANVAGKPTSLADLDPAVSSAITDLQAQTDNKLAVFVQATPPSWTDANANHVGDSWYNTTDLKWYKYNGTSWAVQDSSIYNLNDLASSKTTIHYASGTSTPASYLGVLNDFCLYKNTSTGVMTYYKKTGTSTWTAQPGSYVEGADVTALNTAYDTARVNGTTASTVVANATAGATFTSSTAGNLAYLDTVNYSTYVTGGPPTDADNTATKLATAGTLTLKGTLTPVDSGALKVGSITWNTTTGALTGGSGIAITEAGIIGAKSGVASFSIDTSGNAIFKGDITGANGTFSGNVSTTGYLRGTTNTSSSLTLPTSASITVSQAAHYTNYNGASGGVASICGVNTSTSTSGSVIGVYGSGASSSYGVGVAGIGGNVGVFGESYNAYGDGILGFTSKTGGYAVRGKRTSNGVTIYGESTTSDSSSVGVHGYGYYGVRGQGGLYGGLFSGSSAAIYATGGTHGVSSYGTSYCFYARSGTATGLAGSYGPFTGAHDGVLALADTPAPGDILIDIAILNRGTVSDVLGLNTLSSATKQKSVFGVFVARRFPKIVTTTLNEETGEEIVIDGDVSMLIDMLNAATTYDEFMAVIVKSDLPAALSERKQDPLDDSTFGPVRDYLVAMLQTHNLAVINSVGEGMINVVAEGGNIEAGDYICSSSTPGKGMKQDDDLLHNYTVAKAREDVVWTAEELVANAVKMIACTYHCG